MPPASSHSTASWLRQQFASHWLLQYRRGSLLPDLLAGTVVAIMLVPQAMAYSMLAGLPPQIGLYASVLPLLIYPLFATSRYLAVGPVAIVSLLVAASASQVAPPGSPEYLVAAVSLAVLVGVLQTLMGLLRLGFLVNFLSHAVIAGFTSAAALVIGFSQLKHLLGIHIPRGGSFFELLQQLWAQRFETNLATLALGVFGILLLAGLSGRLERKLSTLGMDPGWASLLCKSGPLLLVLLATLAARGLNLVDSQGVAIVGAIPPGLPPLGWPALDLELYRKLVPGALAISFVGFMESYAVAKALAIRRREKVNANRELVALGLSNLGSAVSSGYPVTGGFSRSMVNHSAGARTGLASIISAVLIAATLVFLTPLFFFLPRAALAAIIVVAVTKLIDLRAARNLFRYSLADGLAFLASFSAVLFLSLEKGVLVGVVASLAMHLWRTSRPHIALVGRVGQSEHFRNIDRHQVTTWPTLLLVRIDESLYFVNANQLEDELLGLVADRPQLTDLVLIASAVNSIDGSALEALESLIEKLRSASVTLHFAEIKGPVMDRLKKTPFLSRLAPGKVFLSTHDAVVQILAERGVDTERPPQSRSS